MTDPSGQNPDKKIIIDEDWKSTVEAERAKAADPSSAENPAADPTEFPMPEATLLTLVSTLGMQAMMALGLIANPVTGKAEQHPEHARHVLDLLSMLKEKTEGNRSSEETAGLDQMLHELRMAYVSIQQGLAAGPSDPGTVS